MRPFSGPLIACLLVTLPAAFAVAGCDKQSTKAPQPAPTTAKPAAPGEELTGTVDISERGAPMPKDAFVAPDDKSVTLASFRGKPLLVNLWATWCVPCVREMPSLDRLAARTRGKLRVLAVNQDSEQATDPVPGWWAEHKLANLELYRDKKTDLGFAFGGGMLPTTVMYDANGNEVWRVVGGMDWDGVRVSKLLAEYLR